jgi:Tol biopolymer transport system component
LQKEDGLSLLSVSKGAVWQLDFQTGKLHELVKLPAELAAFPEEEARLDNYSLNWKEQKLAGTGHYRLFVADLALGKVRWYKNVVGCQRISLSHTADRVAFQWGGSVYIVDLASGKTTEIAAGVSEVTIPQWSDDDSQLLFDNKWTHPENPSTPSKVMIADLKLSRLRVFQEGSDATWVPGTGEVTLQRLGPWYNEFSYWTVPPEGGKGRAVLGTDNVTTLLRYTPDGKYAVYESGYRWDINIKGFEYGEVDVARLADKKSVAVYGPYKLNAETRGNALPLTWAYVKEGMKPGK